MAVKIRLARRGRKSMAMYDIVVADVRAPRNGRYIEKIGNYNPNTDPATIVLNKESALKWVMDGAQPTETARNILSYKGIMIKKHLQVGVNKEAITKEVADKRFEEWSKIKDAKIQAKIDSLSEKKSVLAKARFVAENKINKSRTEALQKKEQEALLAIEAKKTETKETTPAAETKETTPVAEAKETTPVAEAKKTTPATETKETTPVAETKETIPVAEAKKTTPATETKETTPVAEAKKTTPATEKKK